MEGAQSCILKVKKRLDSDTLDDAKILKYLRALDEINIGFDILKSTGIGKSVNHLKKRGGSVAVFSKALIKKWKDLVPGDNESPQKKDSPLNTLKSDFNPEHLNLSTKNLDSPQKNSSRPESHGKKLTSSAESKTQNIENKKRKVATMQLCDLSFVSEEPVPVKKTKKPKPKSGSTSMPNPTRKPPSTLPSPEEIGTSLLPDIQPNYIPQRLPDYPDDNSPKKKKVTSFGDISFDLLASRKSKTQVFSGRRSANRSGVVLSLHESCIRILIENIEALYDTGGVPYDILEPVLAKCTPAQLWNLEDYNPYFIEDTGPLWKAHCHKDFKGTVPENHDDWRSLYLEKHEEREKKLKSINARINASQAAKTPVRQVKLAYIQTQAKAPPQVRRKQLKHGTARGPVVPPPPKISAPTSSTSSHSRQTIIPPKKTKQTALMKKVRQMGSLHRSRANSGIIRR